MNVKQKPITVMPSQHVPTSLDGSAVHAQPDMMGMVSLVLVRLLIRHVMLEYIFFFQNTII